LGPPPHPPGPGPRRPPTPRCLRGEVGAVYVGASGGCVGVTAGKRTVVIGQLLVCARRTKLTPVAITSFSIKRCSVPCKARRVAPPTRVVRAWPSGLDGASAPLAGGHYVMAIVFMSGTSPEDLYVRNRPLHAFIESKGTTSARAQPSGPVARSIGIVRASLWSRATNLPPIPSPLVAA
jgi:hypothetical protein